MIADHHREMLAASGITPEAARLRGYETITEKKRLAEVSITPAGRRAPGLLVPLLDVRGSTWGYQFRPDSPRRLAKGRVVKYETPTDQRNGLDVPPGVGPLLGDPGIPLWVTEGSKKADCAAIRGLCCVALLGVWSWRGTNTAGGKVALPDWHDVALNDRRVIIAYDGDVARKAAVRTAMSALANYLAIKGARIEYLWLPNTDDKTGLDDYLTNGHQVTDLWPLVKPISPPPPQGPEAPDPLPKQPPAEPIRPPAQPIALTEAHATFARWFGDDYDTEALDAMLAAVAVERFDDGSDPLWLLIVSGPGAAKTETVQALDGVGATVTSVIASEAALLSATPRRERAKDATGGLLCKLGGRGVLVIKDVTSILSIDRYQRGKVLSALREVYDGRWSREVGTDGGRSMGWRGRLAIVGAVTTAWDAAHSVVATMGDRFVLVRIDSAKFRQAAGRRAVGNTGDEQRMRAELAAAAAGVIAGMNCQPVTVTDAETGVLLDAADLVTLARTGVEYDYRGNVIDAHAPEMPTRFAKQLTQVIRGAVAIGMDRAAALRLALRCARDSMPPLRLAIIDDLAAHPYSSTGDVRRRIDKPWSTTDRQLQSLHMLGLLTVEECDYQVGKSRWYYTLTRDIDPAVLRPQFLTRYVTPVNSSLVVEVQREDIEQESLKVFNISGEESAAGFILPTGPDRCASCGFHVPTQGHRDTCTAATP